MKKIVCSKCGEVIILDNSDLEQATNLMGIRLAKKEQMIAALKKELEDCHKILMEMEKEDKIGKELPKQNVQIDIKDAEELRNCFAIIEKLHRELFLKKELRDTLLMSGDVCNIEKAQGVREEIKTIQEKLVQQEMKINGLKQKLNDRK